MTGRESSPQFDQLQEAQRRFLALQDVRDRLVIDSYRAGHSYRQIGEVLGVSNQAVQARYSARVNGKFDSLRASIR